MLRRLETMVLMTGYELPLRAIREQIASAVDLIVHTARLKDGSRKIVNITEVYGIEDDEILTQDIFAFEQTGVEDGKIQGDAPADRRPPDVHGPVRARPAIELPPGEYGIPPEDPAKPIRRAQKCRWGAGDASRRSSAVVPLGHGRAVAPAGWSTSRRSGRSTRRRAASSAAAIKEQTRQCLANLQALLEAPGSSLDKVVWANWSLRDPTDFDIVQRGMDQVVPG